MTPKGVVPFLTLSLVLSFFTTTLAQHDRITVDEISSVPNILREIRNFMFEDGTKLVLYITNQSTNATVFHPSIRLLQVKTPRPVFPRVNRIYVLARLRARNDEVAWARYLYGTDSSRGGRRGGLTPQLELDDVGNIYVKREVSSRSCCTGLFYLQKLNKRGFLQWTKEWDAGSFGNWKERPGLFSLLQFVAPNKMMLVELTRGVGTYISARDIETGDTLYTVPIEVPEERGPPRRRYPSRGRLPRYYDNIITSGNVTCVETEWNRERAYIHLGFHCFDHRDGSDLRSRLFHKERPVRLLGARSIMHQGARGDDPVIVTAIRLGWRPAGSSDPRIYYTEVRRISSRTFRETKKWPSGPGTSKMVLRMPNAESFDGGDLSWDEEEEQIRYENRARIVLNGRVIKTGEAENDYTADGNVDEPNEAGGEWWMWSIGRTGPPTLSME